MLDIKVLKNELLKKSKELLNLKKSRAHYIALLYCNARNEYIIAHHIDELGVWAYGSYHISEIEAKKEYEKNIKSC